MGKRDCCSPTSIPTRQPDSSLRGANRRSRVARRRCNATAPEPGDAIEANASRSRWEATLTAGEFGAAAVQTTIVTVLPLLLRRYAPSNFWIGFAVGGEGIFALLVPFWIGVASDRMPQRLATRFGRRMLVLLLVAPVMAISIAVAPFARSYWLMAGAAFVCFAAVQSYITPLWALMLDSVPDERRARVQGVRGILRAAGLGYGLVAAGLLFSIAKPVPFFVAGALILVTTGATWIAERQTGGDREPHCREHAGVRHTWTRLEGRPAAVWILIANALWNGGIDGIRPYVFLYATTVLRITVAQASLRLGILVAGIGVGSAVAGRVGDAFPRGRLLEIGTATLALAFGAATFVRSLPLAELALGVAGVGAAVTMTIGYPYFAALVGEERRGEYTGLWVFSVGLGRILAPMVVGLAIDLGGPMMADTKGYPMMWAMASAFGFAGLLFVRRATRIAAIANDRSGLSTV